MKKTLSFLMACMMLLSLASFASAEDLPVVRMVVPGISEQSTMDPISGLTTLGLPEFQAFLDEHVKGAKVELISIPWDGWIQKIEAMATSGEMDIGFYTNQVAVPDWYLDITPYLEKDADVNLDNLSEWFVEPATHYTYYKSFNYPEATNKIYGLPITMACNFVTYDSQLFADWGVEEPPMIGYTMPELVALAEKMTGSNPVTGLPNYGAYMTADWLEWFSVSYDAIEGISSDDMLLSGLDKAKYVDYIKDSPEVLAFFQDMERLVKNAPAGITTKSGNEMYFTFDNDLAINFDVQRAAPQYMKYLYAGATEMTDRFKPVMMPAGEIGQGFPEFFRFAVTQKANDTDAAWEVLKQLTTNPEIVNFYLINYAQDKICALKDASEVEMMQFPINQARHAYQMENILITDDYWTWRIPMQTVLTKVLAQQITPEQACAELYEGVNAWVENTKAQLGQ